MIHTGSGWRATFQPSQKQKKPSIPVCSVQLSPESVDHDHDHDLDSRRKLLDILKHINSKRKQLVKRKPMKPLHISMTLVLTMTLWKDWGFPASMGWTPLQNGLYKDRLGVNLDLSWRCLGKNNKTTHKTKWYKMEPLSNKNKNI